MVVTGKIIPGDNPGEENANVLESDLGILKANLQNNGGAVSIMQTLLLLSILIQSHEQYPTLDHIYMSHEPKAVSSVIH
jgi:hypothetical protein